jgi:hypothetical protein
MESMCPKFWLTHGLQKLAGQQGEQKSKTSGLPEGSKEVGWLAEKVCVQNFGLHRGSKEIAG